MALQRIFRPLLKRLQRGDVVWIHNRPDFAIALTPHIRRAGGRVVLHLHNAHLVEWPTALMQQVRADRLVFVSDFLRKQAQQKFSSLDTSYVLYNGADEPSSTRLRIKKRSRELPSLSSLDGLFETKAFTF